MSLTLAYVSAGLSLTLAAAVLVYGCTLLHQRLSRVPTSEAVEQRAASLVRIARAELKR